MICPHCHTSFFEEWTQTAPLVWNDEHAAQALKHCPCPECGRLVVKLIEGPIDPGSEEFEIGDDGKDVITSDVVIYPGQSDSDLPPEIPEQHRAEYLEAKEVLKMSPKSSAAIGRRLLQGLLESELGLKNNNLSKQIDSFLDLEHVPSHLSKSIDAIRSVGNFAAHPNKEKNTGNIVAVEPGEAEWILEVLLSLFDFLFVQPKRIERRRAQLNEKLRSLGKPEMKG